MVRVQESNGRSSSLGARCLVEAGRGQTLELALALLGLVELGLKLQLLQSIHARASQLCVPHVLVTGPWSRFSLRYALDLVLRLRLTGLLDEVIVEQLLARVVNHHSMRIARQDFAFILSFDHVLGCGIGRRRPTLFIARHGWLVLRGFIRLARPLPLSRPRSVPLLTFRGCISVLGNLGLAALVLLVGAGEVIVFDIRHDLLKFLVVNE